MPTYSLRRWIAFVTAGEALGFVIPGSAWFAAWKLDFPPLALAATVVAAGAVEGLVLAFSQRHALRGVLDVGRPWIAATAFAAALAWACGMAPNTAYDLGAPAWLAAGLGIAGAPIILLSMGWAQFLVLRKSLARAHRWVWVNVLAWVLALPFSFLGPALVPNDSPDWAFAIAWGFAGIAMAAVLATVTGLGMRRLLATGPG